MKRWLLSILITLASTWAWAQNNNEPFKGHLYNKEYKVYLHINFYQNNILIPGQELFGQVAENGFSPTSHSKTTTPPSFW